MGDLGKAVDDGVKGAAVAGGIVATGVAIGAAVGASFGPFAAVAAPVGAAVGALIGFFVSLGKHTPTEAERQQAAAAAAKAKTEAANIDAMMNDPAYASLFKNIHDALAPLLPLGAGYSQPVGNMVKLIGDVKAYPNASPQLKAGAQAFRLVKTIARMSSVAADPLAYFTDPTLKALIGPGLQKVGIDVNNPNALKLMQANYANPPINTNFIPIVRKSQTDAWNAANLAAGGPGGASRYSVDSRAFNPKIAPYGVSSLPPVGVPLKAPWPWGLDKDNFANPPPADIESLASGGWSTQKKVAAAAGLAGLGYLAYAFFI